MAMHKPSVRYPTGKSKCPRCINDDGNPKCPVGRANRNCPLYWYIIEASARRLANEPVAQINQSPLPIIRPHKEAA